MDDSLLTYLLADFKRPEKEKTQGGSVPCGAPSSLWHPRQSWPIMWALHDRFGCSCLTSEQMDMGAGAVVLAWDEMPEENTRRAALAFARKHWRELLQDMALSAAEYRNCRTWCGEEVPR